MNAPLPEAPIDWEDEFERAEAKTYLAVQPVTDFDEFDCGKRWTDRLTFAFAVVGTLVTWACAVGGMIALGMLIRWAL